MSALASLTQNFVDRIRINRTSREERAGRTYWIKRRRAAAAPALLCANRFFELAEAPIRTVATVRCWQQWELHCFEILHGDEDFHTFLPNAVSVAAEEMPGVELTEPLDDGTLTPRMMAAVGRELARAHRVHCPELAGAWSHGDPHLGNFVYEEAADRARLVDFEVQHLAEVPAAARHADDVLVVLQDMVGRIREEAWLPCALAFLSGYGRPRVISLIAPLLEAPTPAWGFAGLWWMLRTSALAQNQWHPRLEALRSHLLVAFSGADAVAS